ncbi:uncharacterized protein LOC127902358 [Citrus sinensis]|uniref:uncharacterized protein LOC127902358 n=1 Tax=Citrus sinensis TaxID=2711 RepID=UPI002277C3CA|nr:uncharacterized protein LOC127902358 [Citrus sinensis]
MDFVTGLPLTQGFSVILVVVDRLTKFAHFGPLPCQFTALKTAELFVDMVIKIHGFPSSIISDRDPVFLSNVWKQLFLLSGTILCHSTAYHPQTDGQTEVVNRGLEQYLRAFTQDKPRKWVSLLSWAEFSYNSHFHSGLKMSLYQVLFVRSPPTIPHYAKGSTSIQALEDIILERNTLLQSLKANLRQAQHRMAQKANTHRREAHIEVGDKVLVKLQPYRQTTIASRACQKLAKRYYGPFTVLARVGSVAYKLELPSTSKIHSVFHISVLKPYHGNDPAISHPLPELSVDNHPLLLPAAICATQIVLQQGKPTPQVLVQWTDNSPENSSWENFDAFCTLYPAFHLEDKFFPLEQALARSSDNFDIAQFHELRAYDISSIDALLMCGMGLGLFQGVNKMEVARARVLTLVHKLKASCMLLDHISKKEEFFSMHDVVRDVAISIASREQNALTATNEQVDGFREWSDESAVKRYTSIVLHDVRTDVLPEVVECPQLKLLFISADKESSSLTIPNNFFKRMIQVRVINLTYINLLSLPSTLGFLLNLRALSLCYCKLLDISVIGGLKKLEILYLRGSDIKQLPTEVGQLTWLTLLDLRECRKLEVILPNVLSNLSHLEELYISCRSFQKWEVEVEGVKNASVEELKHLPNLTSLELDIHDVNTLPRGLFLEELEKYRIRIGDWYWESTNTWRREFRLRLNNKICLKDWLIVQLQGIEDLELRELQEQDVNYFANELAKVGSSELKFLRIHGCSDALNPPAESKRQEESANDMQSNEIILEDNISNTLFIEKIWQE